MEKTLFEQMGGTYTRVDDYYLPAPPYMPKKKSISAYLFIGE